VKQPALPTVYLQDDPRDQAHFLPFSQSRPLGELRYGAWLLRERVAPFATVAGHIAAPHLAHFREAGAPPVGAAPAGNAKVLRSTTVVDLTRGAALEGKRLDGVWQIIKDLVPALREDLELERKEREGGRVPTSCTVLGDPANLLIDEGAAIEPHVVFDTRNGPIWIQQGAQIRAFCRLGGPLVVGGGTRIVGGHIRESSIGPMCVVHGEVSNCVFLGYANKSHDGFLGHSVVGRWVNLGAGTTNSNLKNTYGPVRLNFGAERVETGMTFMGALIGDHVKTAIGTMLPTGCVIGTGANLFGTKRPEAYVPAFAWGTDEPGRVVACRMFLQTAERMMPRRDVAFDDDMRAYLTSVWQHATGKPCD
jgi:UDP-N-acetylglucosamine diphosphorylase/glucosamine-1-phosphate N-acetyltransferase